MYFCRLNLSIALVSMVKQNQTTHKDSNSSLCPKTSLTASSDNNDENENEDGDFYWSLGAQGMILE